MLSPAPHRAATVAARPQCRTLQMAPGLCTSSCHPCHHTDALLCRWLQGAPSFMALMHSVACCHLCTLPCRWMTGGQQGLPPSCRSCLSLHRRTALHRVPDRCHDLPPWCRRVPVVTQVQCCAGGFRWAARLPARSRCPMGRGGPRPPAPAGAASHGHSGPATAAPQQIRWMSRPQVSLTYYETPCIC